MKKANYNSPQSGPPDNQINPRDSSLPQKNLKGMDSRQASNKDLVSGSDGGLESSIVDNRYSSSDDIYSTANSDTLMENLLKLQPVLQNLKERDERQRTRSEKNRDEYGVLEQKIRQLQREIPKLKEENETPPNMRISQRMNSQEHSACSQILGCTDSESQIDPKLRQNEYSESTDAFQKENMKVEAELQDEIRKGQKFQMTIKDLRERLKNLKEENKALKTELQGVLQNNHEVKWLVYDMENKEWGAASTDEVDKIKCKSSEQHEQIPLVSRQNKRNIEKGCNMQAELLLQEDNSSLRTEASCEQQGLKTFTYGNSNLLMENEDLRNDNSRQSDSLQEQISLLEQEAQAKTELVEIQQKQIGDLLQALVKGKCENARLTSEHNRCMEEEGDANTTHTGLVRAQQENLKLQKELSAKLADLKNLHIMLSTLGREKEIMATELLLKTRILGDMEEDLNDLKEQNEALSSKVESYARDNKTKKRDFQETIASLQSRNKLLAEQVLKTSEGYRSFKRKANDLQEQNSGFKREIANLKASILKQEKFTHVLESERSTLVNEITWGKQQLHFLLKKCKLFQQETESLTEQQVTKQDRHKSLKEEFVLLEQLLLNFKKEMACLEAESDKGVKERKIIKEEIAMLQNELLYFRSVNSLPIQERKLDENRDGSTKRQEDTADDLFWQQESLQAEVTDLNMEKSKLKLDDARDRRTQKQDDAVSSPKMVDGSEARPTMNQTMKFDVVDDLQKSKLYSSEAVLIDNRNARALNWTADINGRFKYIGGVES